VNIVRHKGFTVIGREARTSNAREMSGAGVIGQMWSTVNPKPGLPVAVYSEYESDKDGEYTYTLGVKADMNETLPLNSVKRSIDSGDYVCLKYEGPFTPQATLDLWKQAWTLEHEKQILRAYKTDFEVYSPNGVELYIGVNA
jgi:predicted transcriptional regulator YdeE